MTRVPVPFHSEVDRVLTALDLDGESRRLLVAAIAADQANAWRDNEYRVRLRPDGALEVEAGPTLDGPAAIKLAAAILAKALPNTKLAPRVQS